MPRTGANPRQTPQCTTVTKPGKNSDLPWVTSFETGKDSGGRGPGAGLQWREGTTQLLRWLLAGRPGGPVFLTGRHAPAGSDPAHTCPVTGRARMSYRRAAEIFTAATAPLDPAGRGWTLHQLSLAGQEGRTTGPPPG
jgi:hypothetical protein